MKYIEIEMSNIFRKHVIDNVLKEIQSIKVIKELLLNENIHKPQNTKLKELSISDLKYKTSKIKELKMNIAKGIFIIGY